VIIPHNSVGVAGVHQWTPSSAEDSMNEERYRLRDWQRACELATEWERWWMLRQQTSSTTSQPAVGSHRPRLKSYQSGVPVGANPRWIVDPALAAVMPPPSPTTTTTNNHSDHVPPPSTSVPTEVLSARDAHRQAFVEALHRRLAIDESHIQQNDAIAAALRRDRAHRRATQVMRSGVPHRSVPNHHRHTISSSATGSGNGLSKNGHHTARTIGRSSSGVAITNEGSVSGSSSWRATRPSTRSLPPPIVERSSSGGNGGGNHNNSNNHHNYMPPLPTPRMPMPPYLTTPPPASASPTSSRDVMTSSSRRPPTSMPDDYHYAMSHAQLEKLINGHPLAPARAASIQASIGGGGLGSGSNSRPSIRAAYSGRLLQTSPLKHGTVRSPVDGLYYSSTAAAAAAAAAIYTPNNVSRDHSPTRMNTADYHHHHQDNKNVSGASPSLAFRSLPPTPTTHIITPIRSAKGKAASTAPPTEALVTNGDSKSDDNEEIKTEPPQSPPAAGFVIIAPPSSTLPTQTSLASPSPSSIGRPMTRADIPSSFPLDKLQAATPGGKLPLAILVACGSYSPVTFLHLAVLETARNYLQYQTNQFEIVGGYMSPVHDLYGKASLIPAHHRLAMVERCTQSSDWINASSWEIEQKGWTRTALVLAQYQQFIDAADLYDRPVRVMFLCGTDILESFLVPNLWSDDDIQTILRMGLACLQRQGSDGHAIIEKTPLLSAAKDHIVIIPQRIENTISSTEVRRNLQNNATIKYLTPDPVIDYISTHSLYHAKPRSPASPLLASPNGSRTVSSTIPSSFPLDKLMQPALIGSDERPLCVLVACGSYSPVTYLHLAVFETARNYLQFENSMFEVVGGYMSPTHDLYGKASLIPQHHRVEMVSIPLRSAHPLNLCVGVQTNCPSV
jgi:nicotinamide mononucleotide adenylyltransferase